MLLWARTVRCYACVFPRILVVAGLDALADLVDDRLALLLDALDKILRLFTGPDPGDMTKERMAAQLHVSATVHERAEDGAGDEESNQTKHVPDNVAPGIRTREFALLAVRDLCTAQHIVSARSAELKFLAEFGIGGERASIVWSVQWESALASVGPLMRASILRRYKEKAMRARRAQ